MTFKNYFLPIVICFQLQTMSCNGQKCSHTQLSRQYDFATGLSRLPCKNENDACVVSVVITNKKTKSVQTVKFGSAYLFESAFKDCNQVRSYSTGVNGNLEDVDNDFGDLIVADFNFDAKDDVAIKRDSGGNGGPLYNFHIQNASGKFVLDDFLSNQMVFFPTEINAGNKTLVTLVHANAMQRDRSVFQYDTKKRKWKLKSSKLI